MKNWNDLTEQGQVRRLRKLAGLALEKYDVDVASLRLIAAHTNTLFRVNGHDGQKYALRISTPGEHTLRDNQIELKWLDILSKQTNLPVPTPIHNRAGELITQMTMDGVEGERRCTLFEWVPGKPLADYLSPKTYRQFGELMARMHQFSETFFANTAWPEHLRPMKWDRVFYYPDEPNVLFDENYRNFFSAARLDLIQQVIEKVEPILAGLYTAQETPMIIHGDLHMWNVHYHRGNLYLIDFEDVMWGYPIQDIAITLGYGDDREDYLALRAAFREGYSSIRQWPGNDATIAALDAARTVMFVNYVAHSMKKPEPHIDRLCNALSRYLAG